MWFTNNKSLERRNKALAEVLARNPMSDAAFLEAGGLQDTWANLLISNSVRKRLAQIAKVEPTQIRPYDSFDGILSDLCDWPEFEMSIDIFSLAKDLGVVVQTSRLDHVVDPSAAGRKGTVADLVGELHSVLVR